MKEKSMKRTLIVLLVGAALALAAEQGWSINPQTTAMPPLPEVQLTICTKPPVMDGVLDDECWKAAAVVTNFHVFGTDKTQAERALLTCDAQWLYVAFEIRHPKPKMIKPKTLAHDGHVGGDDDVEVFLDPGSNGEVYFHYLLNPLNTRAEQRMTKQGTLREREWNVPWRSATRVTEQGWSAELALPLTVLASYGDLAKVRINLCAKILDPVIDPYGIIVRHDQTLLSWAPIFTSFHEPNHFGMLHGLDQVKISVPFLPAFKDAKIGKYDLAQGQYSYPLTVQIRNYSTHPGTVELTIVDQPGSGKAAEVTRTVALKGEEQQTLTVAVPVTTLSDRKVQVRLKDLASGAVVQSEPVLDTAVLVLMTAFADRNYYTTEDQAQVVCELGLPAGDLKDMALVARDAAGKEVGKSLAPSPCARVAIPIKTLAPGTHQFKVALCRKGGEPVFSQDVSVLKRAPNPGLEWKIDRLNRVVLKNGEPFIPFGVILSPITETAFQTLAQAGFNSFVTWNYLMLAEYPQTKQFPTVGALRALAEKHQLYILNSLDFSMPTNINFRDAMLKSLEPDPKLPEAERMPKFERQYSQKMDIVRAVVSNLMTSPQMMGYFNIDEPADTVWVKRAVTDYYKLVNEVDGYHPTFINCGIFDDAADIIGADPYWVPASSNNRRNTPNAVVSYLTGYPYRNYIKVSAALHKPLWMVPQGELYSGMHKRIMVPQEQYCQTYLLLIHGVKGFFYFCFPYAHRLSLEALSQLAQEMKTLGPIAGTPDVPQTVQYSPGEMDPAHDKFPDIQVNLRSNPQGGYVLLAANSKYYPVEVVYGVSFLGKNGKVQRLFADDRYQVQDGTFKDTLEGYGVRAYAMEGPAAVTDPVKVSVTMTAKLEAAKAEAPEIPRSGRPGQKNIAPNPSFEEATLPDWPDYYRIAPSYYYLRQTNGCLPYLGIPNGLFGLDKQNPFHGKVSVKLHAFNESYYPSYPRAAAHVYGYLAPQVEKPENYVISAYLRAEKPGALGRFIWQMDPGKTFSGKEFPLTTEWQRYWDTGVVKPGVPEFEYNVVGVSVRGDGGSVWVDALQVERGTTPTPFEP